MLVKHNFIHTQTNSCKSTELTMQFVLIKGSQMLIQLRNHVDIILNKPFRKQKHKHNSSNI